MYEKYWNLNEKPFENTPDPKFLYLSSQHEEALSRLIYVVKQNKGAGLLTGVFGCGKTVLGKALINSLEKDIYKIAYLANPNLEPIDLLRMLLYYLGEENPSLQKSDCLIALERILENNRKDGRKTVFIIDESHIISPQVFEEIRLLLNYQAEEEFLITILLLGQPELKTKIDNNKQLSQRIALRYSLEGLSEEEVKEYINHRLKIAGSKNSNIFTQEAISLIHQRSGGIPRRINQICDMSLLTGFSKHVENITKEIVEEAIESLEK
jgi:type II secretory pathway predicted ATPase ExeA